MTATLSIITAQRASAVKIPNAALRFKLPEPPTNQTIVARFLAKIGLGNGAKPTATNTVRVAQATGTNKVESAESGPPPLTGNEPPEELMRRVRDMRERGEEIPPEISAKIRELFQSGALQRPGGGGGGRGGGMGGGPGGGGGMGGPGGGGGGGSRPRAAMPSWRTIYIMSTNAPAGGGDPIPTPQPVRVRTGITDGSYTEITEGLKEGQVVITSVKLTQTQAAAPPPGASPFGGGGGGRRF
jgi:HlyD family secretion protein